MCETMTSLPQENGPPCILTEDMFDAAMNEQLSFHMGDESEGETSSHEGNMEVDPDSSSINENSQNSSTGNSEPQESQCTRVLVIETGLNKIGQNSTTVNKQPACDVITTVPSDNSNTENTENNTVIKENLTSTNHMQLQAGSKTDLEVKLPLLKEILLKSSQETEPINLCDSDSDEDSGDEEMHGSEVIDDALKSVMESNLLAETGMSPNKSTSPKMSSNKNNDGSSVKIVKSINHVPVNMIQLNNKNKTNTVILSPEHSKAKTDNVVNSIQDIEPTSMLPLYQTKRSKTQSAIHLNRIAVPNPTFVNSRGQKVKCVFVKNPNNLPMMINGMSKASGTKGPVSSPMNLIPARSLQPIAPKGPIIPYSNQKLVNTPNNQKPVKKAPSAMIAMSQRLEKPSFLKNAPSRPILFDHQLSHDSLVKSLLFHNLKKPYKPDNNVQPKYHCLDCSDMFSLQNSLNQHLARRSLCIGYWCRICKRELQFYNRCAFLKHLRGHGCSIKNIDSTFITIRPLPDSMIDSGVASTFLKDDPRDVNQILIKIDQKYVQESGVTRKAGNEPLLLQKPSSSVIKINPANNTNIVSGQSNVTNFHTSTMMIENNPPTSIAPCINDALLSTTSNDTFENIQKQVPDQSQVNNTPGPNHRDNVYFLSQPMKRTGNGENTIATENNMEITEVEDDVHDNLEISTNEEVNTVENMQPPEITEKNKKTKPQGRVNRSRRQCNECGVTCYNISKHLNGANRPLSPKLMCGICDLILPTQCALKIHNRLHKKLPPYKCPDCGKDFKTWDEVNSHIKFSCGHAAKCVRYLCVSCKSHFATSTHLSNHISAAHSRDIFKCTSCPVAFYSRESLNKHLRVNHANESVIGLDYKQCSMCPKQLVPTDKYPKHVEGHTVMTNVMIYGFKCPHCAVVFANKMAFIIHLIKEKREIEERAAQKKGNITSPHTNTQISQMPIASEPRSLETNFDIEEEPVIVKKYLHCEDDSILAEKDPLSLDGWEHPNDQVNEIREELCIVCKKNSVVILPGVSFNDLSLCCKQCVKPVDEIGQISKRAVAQKKKNNPNNSAKRKRSSSKPAQRSFSHKGATSLNKKRKSNDSTYSEIGDRHFLLDEFLVDKKSYKKPKQKKNQLSQSHIHPFMNTNAMVCAKCEFETESRKEFLEHITVYRTDPNTCQCMECGLCFQVLPALEKHLFNNHKIKDMTEYIENNSFCLPQPIASIQDTETEDNQCRVCREKFDSISSLEKHFRCHGMAFMNRLCKSP